MANEIRKLANPKVILRQKEAKAGFEVFAPVGRASEGIFTTDVDKLAFDNHRSFSSIIKNCRFFYRHDPLASTVINKIVDFSINDLVIDAMGNAKTTESEIYAALVKDLLPFLKKAAREYLLTGLVVPEIRLERLNKKALRAKGIKRINRLLYPTSLWVRDSATINIRSPLISEKESYFVVIDDQLLQFLQNKGEYSDGTKDTALYEEIIRLYPDFVKAVLAGETQVLLENPLIVKGTTTEDSPFPIPYLFPALESLKHKRNLRRMDYSIAARVISAILHVKVGNDLYPLTEDQEDVLGQLEQQLQWRRNITPQEIERVFALFTNHTVEIDWIFPEVSTMLDDVKYESVNEDIMVALGFPRILVTGETKRSFASDPQIATISPLHSMEGLRTALLPIVEFVYLEMASHNKVIELVPEVSFRPINLMSMALFFEGIKDLYESGNLSREDWTDAYGFDFRTQQIKRKRDEELMTELGVDPVAPSNTPGANTPGAKQPGRPNTPPEE